VSAPSPAPIHPQRSSLARAAFALAYAGSLAWIVLTLDDLPNPVASSFGAGGVPHGFMPRRSYAALYLGLGAALPLAMLCAFSWLPRRFPRLASIPHRRAWLAPERRGALFARMDAAGIVVASATALFFAATHALVRNANAASPPRLAHGPFFIVMFCFAAATAGTALWLSWSLRAERP
jgi:hypothetical protein